jgi:CheY-like chemotaxis protein
MQPQSSVIPDGRGPRASFSSVPGLQEEVFPTLPPKPDAERRYGFLPEGVAPPLLLLADDDDHDAFFFRNALRAAAVSLRLTRVRDGQEAIDYFQGRNGFADRAQFPVPQIILLDVKMPRRNGLEVLRFVRATAEFENTLVVILTSSPNEQDIRESRRLRVAAYLVKPRKVAALIDIAHHLEVLWLETVVRH